MKADDYPHDAWERLGRSLTRRRVELDPSYANRAEFLRATGLNKKFIERLETASPANYRDATLAKAELAYRWEEGSIRGVLEGREPASASGAPVADEADETADKQLRQLALADALEELGIDDLGNTDLAHAVELVRRRREREREQARPERRRA